MLQQQLKQELTEAMRSKDTLRLSVIRGIVSAATNELVAKGRKPQDELSDEEMLAVIRRLAKQRKDSAEQFRTGGREELAQKEEAELAILETYLPAMMDRDAIRKVAETKKAELGITDKSKLGMLVGAVMKELKGQADGNDVKAVAEELLF